MVDWNNGEPNARFWVLKLLHDKIEPGDKLVENEPSNPAGPNDPYVYSLALVTKSGKHRLLLVNKRDRVFDVSIPDANGAQVDYVDQTTSGNPPATMKLGSDVMRLAGFSVAVVTLP